MIGIFFILFLYRVLAVVPILRISYLSDKIDSTSSRVCGTVRPDVWGDLLYVLLQFITRIQFKTRDGILKLTHFHLPHLDTIFQITESE
jgi:hypothetical protein